MKPQSTAYSVSGLAESFGVDESFVRDMLSREGISEDDIAAYSPLIKGVQQQIEPSHDYQSLSPPIERDADRAPDSGTVGRDKVKKPRLKHESFHNWLVENKVSIAYNDITHAIRIKGITDYEQQTVDDNLETILYDRLCENFAIGRLEILYGYIKLEASANRYNPLNELLLSLPDWDGDDYIGKLFGLMRIKDDELSCVLVRKWLYQALSLALYNSYDEPFGADGVLVLQGEQGIGKTSLVAGLGMRPELYKLGVRVDPDNKDTLIAATGAWICEMGEMETTLRSDLEALKNFITAPFDEIRLPYGRKSEKNPRRTSFVGTCNNERFLRDMTGSRRFWTVKLPCRIPYDEISRFPFGMLWKQVLCEVKGQDTRQNFRLTSEEQERLAERNRGFDVPLCAEDEVRDICAHAAAEPDKYVLELMTVTRFKEWHGSLSHYSVEKIGRALKKLGAEEVRKGKERLRLLPRLKGSSTSVTDVHSISEEAATELLKMSAR